MNDRYLFRAKRIDNGEWVEGAYYIEPYTDKCFIIRWNSAGLGFNEFIEVDDTSVCQCTALTDKNGKMIWENDILCGHLDSDYPEDVTYERVLWNVNGFYTKESRSIDFNPLEEIDSEWFEVCGNAIDNPELLEVE